MNSPVESVISNIPESISGILQRYHDRYLADGSLPDLDVILICVYLIEAKNNKSGAPYDYCRELFKSLGRKEANFTGNMSLARKQNLLNQEHDLVYLTANGLKRLREKIGLIEKSPVHIIKSGQNFTAIRLFEEFLSSEIQPGKIQLCDSHVSASTLFPFSILGGKIAALEILTSEIHDRSKFDDYRKKFAKESGTPIEVKLSRKLHDRYLISGGKCWTIGASIKDLGNKDTIIREISEVTDSMTQLFNERWVEATSA